MDSMNSARCGNPGWEISVKSSGIRVPGSGPPEKRVRRSSQESGPPAVHPRMPDCTLVAKVRISEGKAYSTPTVGPRDRADPLADKHVTGERTNSEGDVCSLPADAHSTAFSLLQPRAPSPFPTRITSFHFIAAVLAGRRRARIEAKERRVGEASRRRAGEASRWVASRRDEASRRARRVASEARARRVASRPSGQTS